jgi:hypothetical protein
MIYDKKEREGMAEKSSQGLVARKVLSRVKITRQVYVGISKVTTY